MDLSNFICWKYSGDTNIYTISNPIISNIKMNEISRSGFVFFPFNRENQGFLFEGKIEKCKEILIKKPLKNNNYTADDISKKDFVSLVKKAINDIKKGLLDKVVLARCSTVNLPKNFDLNELFADLCYYYKNSFVYCIKFDKELWIGATPELLLKNKNGNMTTYALAGTKETEGGNKFGDKEIAEQEFVKKYINEILVQNKAENIHISKRKELQSGNLTHIINEIKFSSDVPLKILYKLHPTPAVCGIPFINSMDFIIKNENLEREYYSGFLGPIKSKDEFELWVNIRCAKLNRNQIRLYAGAGITVASNPEKEWEETENKMNILRNYITRN